MVVVYGLDVKHYPVLGLFYIYFSCEKVLLKVLCLGILKINYSYLAVVRTCLITNLLK
jgi:hypothetical protein